MLTERELTGQMDIYFWIAMMLLLLKQVGMLTTATGIL